MALAAVQFVPPPPVQPAPPQRGQAAGTATPQPAPLDAAQCKCSIEVTVKHSGTGEPISDVEVSLTSPNRAATLEDFLAAQAAARTAGTGSNTVTATTDNSGRVEFRNLEEGVYTVVARRDGYFGSINDTFPTQSTATVPVGPAVAQSGARATAPPGVTVVPPRQPVQQITLNMVQGATIAGRIQDANRRPASGVQVGAFRVAYQNGHRVLNQVGMAVMTDDRGEYRLFWFPPGEYYIRTGGARAAPIAAGGGSNFPVSTYYPGTTDPKSARTVTIREGGGLAGIDIGLQPATGVTVSGTIVNTIPGGLIRPNGQVNRAVSSVYLVPRNSVFFEIPPLIPNIGGGARGARGGAANDSESAFEIRGVPPGTYDFYPVYSDGTAGRGASGVLSSYYTARTPIEVGGENVTGIQSVIKPGANLNVRVTVTGTAPASGRGQAQPITLTSIRLQIQPKENIPTLAIRALTPPPALDANGVTTLTNLVDGQYFIAGVNPLPPQAYVSEIRQDSRSIYDDNIFVIGKDSETTLEVVISRGGGTIQGTVRDAKHNPVASRITLVPDPQRRQNALLYKNAISNAMGVFNISGVAPGAYKVFAWEQFPAGAEQDPDFMREYDVLGSSVNVTPGLALANVEVTLIPAKH
jgi:hypothetical protein